ncbi:MAG: glycosyl hydrolase [Lachnospiraceae bacterium]|nr:glycosyl hydrolase [Lachnospiraceae bacterium]
MKELLFYTRKPIDNVYYDPRIAFSMHLALKEGDTFEAINHNSGVLFALATENEDGSLNPKSLRNPWIFSKKDGTFGVLAVRTDGEGELDEESIGAAVLFSSKDLLEYKEVALIKLCDDNILDLTCVYNSDKDVYTVKFVTEKGCFETNIKDVDVFAKDNSYYEAASYADEQEELCIKECSAFEKTDIVTDIEGAIVSGTIMIEDAVADRLYKKLTAPKHVDTIIDKEIDVTCEDDIKNIRATAVYSDGTTAVKRIDWDMPEIDYTKPGKYEICGKLHKDHFEFPISFNRADPCITFYNGKYYFIATNDADHEHSLYVREADTIPKLVDAEEHQILNTDMYDYVGGLLWAPEFHEVNGKLYIFLALTPGEFFYEESHIMELCEGGNPKNMSDWSAPKRVVKADGTDICEAGKEITLDMTCFLWEGDYYVIWSQRQFIPKDLGAWLYIAKLNPECPYKLLTEPVVLSKPDYSWANNHTFVDEGPFALLQDDRLIITFSSAAVDTSYVVSRLVIEKGKDLLNRDNWNKCNYPILTSRSMPGEFGTGHNAYVTDEYGDIWNTYHARPGVDGVRSSGIRRVHMDIDGLPILDLTEDLDVTDEIADVSITINVCC